MSVDGTVSEQLVPQELQAAAESESSDLYVVAERIDNDLWGVRIT